MCGRYTLRTPPADWAPLLGVEPPSGLQLRFNIAPTQELPIVRLAPDGGRELVNARWGLVPPWADEPAIGGRMINARSETAATSPAFRHAYEHRRCLVPADGFYEWKPVGKHKQPYYICRRDRKPFAFAGLWEVWRRGDSRLTSFTILTTQANTLVRPLHDRMPVILHPSGFADWLDSARPPQGAMLAPYPDEELVTLPVNPAVNNARYDAADCLAPAAGETKPLFAYDE